MNTVVLDSDLDHVAEIALGVVERLEDNPAVLFTHLLRLCTEQPGHASQLIMCLAAWIDLDQDMSRLWMLAERKAAVVSIGTAG